MEEPESEGRFGVKQGEMGFGLGLDEIQGLIGGPPETDNSSFTALLGLPPPQAVGLLVKEDFTNESVPLPFFPSNASLLDHASKFSVFASADAPLESTTMLSALGSRKVEMVKHEPLDSNSWPNSSSPAVSTQSLNPTKRKHREKQAKESIKKNKPGENEAGSGEKLPYVHVRARRGQATDSHSLAERARREKINARMKLLQELVPGCNKISGTALVLDEIINHVQALQRQVEFLSMRLAAVDPRVDFNLDCLLAAESGAPIDTVHPALFAPPVWPDHQMNLLRQHQYQQPLQFDVQHQHPAANFVAATENPLPRYGSPSNSASRHLKMEL